MARSAVTFTLFAVLFVATLTLRAAQDPGGSGAGSPATGAPVVTTCRISGRAQSGTMPLPGVTLTARSDSAPGAVTASAVDGRYELTLKGGAAYTVTIELTGFTPVERSIDTTAGCPPAMDVQLAVAPRTPVAPNNANAGRGVGGGGRGAGAGINGGRFETLTIQRQAAGLAADTAADSESNQIAQLALPPGFSTEGPTDAVAVNGTQANVDRGQLNDRLAALGRGEFGPPGGDFDGAFAALAGGAPGGFAAFGQGGPGGAAGPGPGGRGGFGGPGGPAGPGGPGGPGGRGFAGRGQQQRPYNFSTGYTFGGSVLDTAPYELRPDASDAEPDYVRQNADLSFGGPVKIPGLYDGTRRTNFTLNYTANRGASLFDQYATVPTAAMRSGDFSSLSQPIVNPATGLPFTGNQLGAIDPRSAYLLKFVPLPNLAGTARNFHTVTTTNAVTDNFNLRITHNFTPNAPGRGGRGGFGGRGGGGGGGNGRGAQLGTSAQLNTQVQYRRNDNDRNSVFSTLSGSSTSSSLTIPITLNVSRRRVQHSFTANLSRTHSTTTNQYAYVENVAGAAGINGASTDAFDWGVPALSFASLTSLNDLTPAIRSDSRLTLGYSWARPFGRHTLRFGGDMRRDVSSSRTDANARGSFVFTGAYSGNDFADFLLGTAQQASVAYGPGEVSLHGRSMNLFVQDDWRRNGRLTFNFGLRYELTWPLVEGNDHLVNLDVAPDFTAAVPVAAGGTGPYSGQFPDGFVHTDINNLAPRLGVAWRAAPGTVVRGGYGVSFNSGTYAQLARQLASQPPYAVTNTTLGSLTQPLAIENALTLATAATTTNTFGVDPDYQLGRVQTLNVDVSKDLTRQWTAGAGYTYAIGSNLDLVRAPNRGPTGLRIEGVQPFLWQTSESSSRLHSATFRLRRRPVRGIGGGLTYTLARSRDNASTIGGGATVVAQDDQNLDAEWGLSSFDRRHQFSGNFNFELPFGPNRRWFGNGGFWGGVLQAWSGSLTFTAQSGTPLTARVLSSVRDVARGTNGTLRADYNGQPIQLSSPTIDRFFNTDAFSVPGAGLFGTSGRNMIIGPGSKDLSAQFSRDVTLSGTRTLSVQLRANNLLNLINYASVDTVVNSPSFGQVTSARQMRSMQLVLRFRY